MNNFSLFHGDPLLNHTKNTASAANPILSSVFQCLKGGETKQRNQKQMDELRKKTRENEHGAPKKEGLLKGGGERRCRRVARRMDERE